MRDWDCRMILALPTPSGPMRELVDAMAAREGQDGILSLSIAHGFHWGEHPRTGTRALAICDGDEAKAASEAARLGLALHDLRHALNTDISDIARALDLTQRFGQLPAPMGEAVWISIDQDIVINDIRTQTFHPEAFTQLGIDLFARRYLWVKSSNHHQAGFNPIAARVVPVATPGAITPDFANIPDTRRARDYYPAVEDPLA